MSNPLEQTLAKGAGMVGAVGAHLRGLDGVFATLVSQHREAASLLSRALDSDDPDKRRELWSEIRRKLMAHETAEKQVVYATLQSYAGMQQIVMQHDREADALDAAIAEVDDAGYANTGWTTSVRALIALIEDHVRHEEEDFFPRALEAIGSDTAKGLSERYDVAHEALMGGK